MAFRCSCCGRFHDLNRLAPALPSTCACLVCTSCARASVDDQLRATASRGFEPQPPAPPPGASGGLKATAGGVGGACTQQQQQQQQQHARARLPSLHQPGDTVLYRTADGAYVEAVVDQVDISVQPPQYGIRLPGARDLRFTEQHRLLSTQRPAAAAASAAGNGAATSGAANSGAHGPLQPPPPTAAAGRCPGCGASLPGGLAALRPLAPDLVAAWEAERTAAWLRVHDVISCPHPGCGALIMRVPAAAASASAPASAAASPHSSPYPSPLPPQRQRQASQGAAAAAPPPDGPYTPSAADLAAAARRRAAAEAAAAHRERHRYRCSACRRDFCDLCGAAPYHGGLTCAQARSPECLLCGDRVEQQERLTALLPVAAAAVACDHNDDDAEAAESEGSGRDGTGAADVGAGGAAPAAAVGPWAAAVVRRAGRGELLRALRGALDLDTSWCLERRDLERALLHYGCRTCAAPDCGAKRAAMCGRPLPCGHWCCGPRPGRHDNVPEPAPGSHPHQGHPRCVECGADPITGAPPAAGAGASAAAARLGRGQAAIATDCCYCQEPLRSAPCIELACGRRHVVHLVCANARLRAGYPGPHISFGHLYCPLCRDSDPAAGSNLQAALGPVHLDHPALAVALAPHLSLREAVAGAARQRLRLDAELKADPALRPGGKYDGRPADFALERLLFYKCSKCAKPYFGGARACGTQAHAEDEQQQQQADGAGAGGGAGRGGHRADELVCGDCCAQAAGTNCPKHGTAYIEWKCRYCCSLATWFCFGSTHMCNTCHQDPFNLRGGGRDARGGGAPGGGGAGAGAGAAECRDPRCSLRARGIPHPPPGREACLGCGMCRAGL
ncbi:hypothetical protein HYH02_000390 [Chlamydomonas schloesseri]|uniref:IBR domain-containing protein n=1 Tax=Chlamydomonas schloesseri TaxID=2026947 RepID=A0A835WYB6_9CHLO|nr:hypothetical protein HYH02_000390 [Chlamydomonas schloesseri]|eukprot:KAG2454545.1 hypothetical protein HYH02_000390 [Chlamydomonas schloesseri]